MTDFAAFLKSRLQRRGDLARLVRESGIAGPVIMRWRDGENRPRPESVEKLAPALGVSYEELMALCGYPTPQPQTQQEPSDELERDLRARAQRFEAALRGVPRVFWPTVLDASLALAEQMKEQPEPPVSPPGKAVVSGPPAVVIVLPPRREPELPPYSLPSQRLLAVA